MKSWEIHMESVMTDRNQTPDCLGVGGVGVQCQGPRGNLHLSG